MEREIKFRAWEYGAEIMHYEVRIVTNGFYIPDNSYTGHLEGSSKDHFIRWDDENPKARLMQYTGLKDKNGKEVFEGDVVKWTNDYKEYHKDIVKRVNTHYFCGFSFGYEPKVGTDEAFYTFVVPESIEVKGNIYENPDLLKEVENE